MDLQSPYKARKQYSTYKNVFTVSEDNLTWETIYEFTKYTTPMNETIEVIQSDKNNKKSRYWRLYITESINKSYVDLLKIQFYGK